MQPFIISTENFIAKVIACCAIKNHTDKMSHKLYCRVSMNKNKIVISSPDELIAWKKALIIYIPQTEAEKKVCQDLKRCATLACSKRSIELAGK